MYYFLLLINCLGEKDFRSSDKKLRSDLLVIEKENESKELRKLLV